MERLRDDHRFSVVKRQVRLCALRLRSRPELAACAGEMAGCRAALKRAEEAYDDALDARVAATLEIEYRDAHLGKAVSSLARDVNTLVEGRTDDARYRRIFLVVPSEGMKPLGGDAQDRFVANVLDTLASDEAFVDQRKHAPTIRARQEALVASVAGRKALALEEARASRDLDIAADDARRLYNQMIHRVSLQYPDDDTLVESFFAQPQPERATPAAAPADPSAPRGGTLANADATAAVVQQPANEAARAAPADRRARRRRRAG